ncbi:hypothetical protein D3C83_160600 [compost metagenome]
MSATWLMPMRFVSPATTNSGSGSDCGKTCRAISIASTMSAFIDARVFCSSASNSSRTCGKL